MPDKNRLTLRGKIKELKTNSERHVVGKVVQITFLGQSGKPPFEVCLSANEARPQNFLFKEGCAAVAPFDGDACVGMTAIIQDDTIDFVELSD